MTRVVRFLLRASAGEGLDLETKLDALREAGFWIADGLCEPEMDME